MDFLNFEPKSVFHLKFLILIFGLSNHYFCIPCPKIQFQRNTFFSVGRFFFLALEHQPIFLNNVRSDNAIIMKTYTYMYFGTWNTKIMITRTKNKKF